MGRYDTPYSTLTSIYFPYFIFTRSYIAGVRGLGAFSIPKVSYGIVAPAHRVNVIYHVVLVCLSVCLSRYNVSNTTLKSDAKPSDWKEIGRRKFLDCICPRNFTLYLALKRALCELEKCLKAPHPKKIFHHFPDIWDDHHLYCIDCRAQQFCKLAPHFCCEKQIELSRCSDRLPHSGFIDGDDEHAVRLIY